ncbi:hypothetical protein B0T25DRAFT_239783 [Lasiosphaeria hispida]|uniref:Uncharacterized protein n=1 Tax=Lasiosphaeria hispida TaxID=260671 RepID=A0AAJ0HEF4_9PEZI|nr:hypothetical protein B0T25DRAFT_239783 [Lasiosphaeria hispida]
MQAVRVAAFPIAFLFFPISLARDSWFAQVQRSRVAPGSIGCPAGLVFFSSDRAVYVRILQWKSGAWAHFSYRGSWLALPLHGGHGPATCSRQFGLTVYNVSLLADQCCISCLALS